MENLDKLFRQSLLHLPGNSFFKVIIWTLATLLVDSDYLLLPS